MIIQSHLSLLKLAKNQEFLKEFPSFKMWERKLLVEEFFGKYNTWSFWKSNYNNCNYFFTELTVVLTQWYSPVLQYYSLFSVQNPFPGMN
jgi:hypothetical protein